MRSRDGKLMSVYIYTGITYEPPKIQITEADARRRASKSRDVDPSEWSVIPHYSMGKSASLELRQLWANRRRRLSYWLEFNNVRVEVDAITGETMAGMRRPASLTPVPQPPKPIPSEQKAIRQAMHFAQLLDYPFETKTITIETHLFGTSVRNDDASFFIDPSGLLLSFDKNQRDPRPEDGALPFLRSANQCEKIAREFLKLFKAQPGLELQFSTWKREPESGDVRMFFCEKPYGYWSTLGNCAHVSLSLMTGKVQSLTFTRGLTHEPPNIKITRDQAVKVAIREKGGRESDWKVDLYYFYPRRVPRSGKEASATKKLPLRVCYSLYFDGVNVIVDSATGKVVDVLSVR
jgi:hypothetical protein